MLAQAVAVYAQVHLAPPMLGRTSTAEEIFYVFLFYRYLYGFIPMIPRKNRHTGI